MPDIDTPEYREATLRAALLAALNWLDVSTVEHINTRAVGGELDVEFNSAYRSDVDALVRGARLIDRSALNDVGVTLP